MNIRSTSQTSGIKETAIRGILTFPALEKNSYTSLSSAFKDNCNCNSKKIQI